MSEAQLERSVLEGKEREELFAIADALGTRPTSRAKKADLVTAILRATGVEYAGDPAPAPAPARRTRTRRPAADAGDTASEPAAAAAGEGAPTSATGPLTLDDTSGVAGPVPEGEEGSSTPVQPAAPEAAPPGDPGPPVATPALGPAGSARSAASTGSAGSARSAGSAGSAPAAPASANGAAGGTDGGDGEGRSEGEGGSRRNRRRRGRDRDRGERELQGQAAEVQYHGEPIPVAGLLDLREEGYGFIRTAGSTPSPDDVYVSISQVRRFALRRGDQIEGAARPAGSNEKYPALLRIDTISGLAADEARGRPRFESLTPLYPDSRLTLELPADPSAVTARIVDLIAPIGKGQRGLVVSPPKAGKTTVLQQICRSIEANHPEVTLLVLLVDERPEEVTDMRRSVKGEVIASTFDRPAEEHTQVAELTIERAKRLVEAGRDVVVVLDGITRLARAYNLAAPATGRVMSGGIDTGALYPPKRFFGAARNIEEGGSLTILATALVETGSKMDEVIFEEFKGTGNMELRLDRRLAERRLYPALDVNGSSTRHEELLFDRSDLQQVWKLRRALGALSAEGSSAPALELLLDKLRATRTNREFLTELASS